MFSEHASILVATKRVDIAVMLLNAFSESTILSMSADPNDPVNRHFVPLDSLSLFEEEVKAILWKLVFWSFMVQAGKRTN